MSQFRTPCGDGSPPNQSTWSRRKEESLSEDNAPPLVPLRIEADKSMNKVLKVTEVQIFLKTFSLQLKQKLNLKFIWTE